MKKKERVFDMISFSDFGKKGMRNEKIEKIGLATAAIGLAAVALTRFLDYKQTRSVCFPNSESANLMLNKLYDFFLDGEDGDQIEIRFGSKEETEEAPAE